MPMEAEVPMLFLSCFSVVFLIKIVAGTSLVRRQKARVGLWIGHLLCELASFYFLLSILFAGRLPFFPAGDTTAMFSENASVGIAMFGVCWAFSVFFLLALLADFKKK